LRLAGARRVAIYRQLQELAFDADDAERMGAAYEQALVLLKLKDRGDPLTELIASHIIEVVAQTGEREPKTICALALDRLSGAGRKLNGERSY